MTARLVLLALLVVGSVGRAIAQDGDHTGYRMTAMSLDGRLRAEVTPVRPVDCGSDGQGSTDNGIHRLTVTDVRTGKDMGAFIGDFVDGPNRFGSAYAGVRFSPDASAVYVVARRTLCETGTWVDSPGVYRIDLRTPRSDNPDLRSARFVAPGRLVGIVRDGPYTGYLIIQQRGKTGDRDSYALFGPMGEPVRTPLESQQRGIPFVMPWIRKQGWEIY